MIIFMIISIATFIILQYNSDNILDKVKELNIYRVWEEGEELGKNKVSETDFSLKDHNIWSHTHRMYLIGFNSLNYPWFIPKDFPRDALAKADREKLLNFIDKYNHHLQWSDTEKNLWLCFRFLFPPLEKTIHWLMRRRKFRNL